MGSMSAEISIVLVDGEDRIVILGQELNKVLTNQSCCPCDNDPIRHVFWSLGLIMSFLETNCSGGINKVIKGSNCSGGISKVKNDGTRSTTCLEGS